jgi:hypothetical protein
VIGVVIRVLFPPDLGVLNNLLRAFMSGVFFWAEPERLLDDNGDTNISRGTLGVLTESKSNRVLFMLPGVALAEDLLDLLGVFCALLDGVTFLADFTGEAFLGETLTGVGFVTTTDGTTPFLVLRGVALAGVAFLADLTGEAFLGDTLTGVGFVTTTDGTTPFLVLRGVALAGVAFLAGEAFLCEILGVAFLAEALGVVAFDGEALGVALAGDERVGLAGVFII